MGWPFWTCDPDKKDSLSRSSIDRRCTISNTLCGNIVEHTCIALAGAGYLESEAAITCSIEDPRARKISVSRDFHCKDGAIEISQIRITSRRAENCCISLMDRDQYRAINADIMGC